MEMELIKNYLFMGIMVVISELYIKWMPGMVGEVVANNTAVIADTRRCTTNEYAGAGVKQTQPDIKEAIQGEQVKVEEINKAVTEWNRRQSAWENSSIMRGGGICQSLNIDRLSTTIHQGKARKSNTLLFTTTANRGRGAGAMAHYKYFGGGNRNSSAHYFVDDKEIVQIIGDSKAAWHCGIIKAEDEP